MHTMAFPNKSLGASEIFLFFGGGPFLFRKIRECLFIFPANTISPPDLALLPRAQPVAQVPARVGIEFLPRLKFESKSGRNPMDNTISITVFPTRVGNSYRVVGIPRKSETRCYCFINKLFIA